MEHKNCRKCNKEFILDEDDISFYKKMKVPNPEVCPDCRFKMRAIWRNETTLYTGKKCDLCQKNIVTMYNPKLPYKVYCSNCYRGDKWNSKSYALDYDFNKTFFEQFNELLINVPKNQLFAASSYGPNINSEFVNASALLKDCYLVFNTGPAENSMYSRGLDDTNEVLDAYFSTKDELCYEIINTHESSRVIFSKDIKNSVSIYLSEDLSGCINCFGCVGLRNKSNCIYNQQVTKEEFSNFINNFQGSYKRMVEALEKFNNFRLQFPKKENHNISTINSIGDYLNNTKNVKYSFEVRGSGENCKYVFSCKGPKDCIGITGYGVNGEQLLECVSTRFSSNVIGSYAIEQSQNILYSFSCLSSNHDLIGCDSLKNSQHCILNKQYSKEEYEKIREHIVKELTDLGIYGLMIPPELAPFAYNETIGQDNMPLTREEAISQGFRWEDDIQKTEGKETLKREDIADHIKDIDDSITREILACKDCNRNYKITEQELLFYKKMNLPIPRKCFYCRHQDRIKRRGPYKFWNRNCAKCDKDIVTNYAPERPEIVYCERCYQNEVY